MNARVLIAGVGNVFLGDDGFGVEVARRLASEALPEGVRAADFGIRALHLAYELLDLDGASLVLVDAMERGERPGTVFVLEPDVAMAERDAPALDAHAIHPALVLRMARGLGAKLGNVRVVGCEPAMLEGMSLSPPVARAVNEAACVAREIAESFRSNGIY